MGVIIAWYLVLRFGTVDIPAPRVSSEPIAFNGLRAFEETGSFCTSHLHRVIGSPESRDAAAWIASRLRNIGFAPRSQRFSAEIESEIVAGVNLFAASPGSELDKWIVLSAHYDSPKTAGQGATDDASGVGTLLELARVLSAGPHRYTLIFLFTDGEEWGMLGARAFIRDHRPKIVVAMSLDYAGPGKPETVGLDCAAQRRGSPPVWLRMLCARAAASMGWQPRQPVGLEDALVKAIPVSFSDSGAFVGAGIPALDLTVNADDKLNEEVYHTKRDVIENLRLESLTAFGGTAERVVRSIGEYGIPSSCQGLFLSENRVLPAHLTLLLLALIFLPLVVAWCGMLRQVIRRPGSVSEIRADSAGFLFSVAPWILGYIVTLLLRAGGLIVRYSGYPATPRDPILYHPQWLPIILTFGSVLLFWVLLARLRRRLLPEYGAHYGAGHFALMTWLLIVIGFTFSANPYSAAILLGPPALLWQWVSPGGPARRVLNAALALAGGLMFYLVVAFFARLIHLGWYMLWYIYLQAAGYWSKGTVLLFLAALTIQLSLLAVGLRAGAAHRQEEFLHGISI